MAKKKTDSKTKKNTKENKKVNSEKKVKVEVKNEEVKETKFNSGLWNKVLVILGILVFLSLFYLLTLYITNKHSDKSTDTEEEEQEVSFSYDDIVIGRSLSMGDDDYLVIYYEGDNEDIASTYDELVSNYKAKEDHLKIYYVDMSSAFNSSFSTTEESNKNPENVTDFKINGPTLMKVSGGKVVDYFEGESSISEFLG